MDYEIKELIDKQQELKFELKDIQHRLADMILNYEGSLREALESRLVRLNFPAPPGFHRYLSTK